MVYTHTNTVFDTISILYGYLWVFDLFNLVLFMFILTELYPKVKTTHALLAILLFIVI